MRASTDWKNRGYSGSSSSVTLGFVFIAGASIAGALYTSAAKSAGIVEVLTVLQPLIEKINHRAT